MSCFQQYYVAAQDVEVELVPAGHGPRSSWSEKSAELEVSVDGTRIGQS